MRVLRLLGLGMATVILASNVASATPLPVTYTLTAPITGSIGSFDISFVDPATQLDFGADRSNAVVDIFTGMSKVVATTATVTVPGVGTATITSPVDVFIDPSAPTPVAGVGVDGGATILATQSAAFGSLSLATSASIGPITGPSLISAGMSFDTTMGELIINSAGDSTFTGVVAPEPASMLLLGTGLLGMGARRWRARRQRR